MKVTILKTRNEVAEAAAAVAAGLIRKAIASKRFARVILAAGQSQGKFLSCLARQPVDWSRVVAFPLAEYIGLPATHPGSQHQRIKMHFADLAQGLKKFCYLNGAPPDPSAECRRLADVISLSPIDLACIEIGENGSLALNGPPADFINRDVYRVVTLDDGLRHQGVGEDGFSAFDDVPRQAICMNIRQILRSRTIIGSVPGEGMAGAVRDVVEGAVTPHVPASILREHPDCRLCMDEAAAGLLKSR